MDDGLQIEMLRQMLRIRRFEERVLDLVAESTIVGSAHPYMGEEAVAVGACSALRRDDYVTGTHRSHGHILAKGGDLKRCMAELLGKATGYCKGKGGSMHLADFSIGMLGASGIVGSALPVAAGAALGAKLAEQDRVVVCFFGDGASNQGAFHEALNLSSLWKLPVVFVCENNQYAQSTNYRNSVSAETIADRAVSYNMPGVRIDGQDVLAVYETVGKAVARARAGQGPSLIEALTYRYFDHSVFMERLLHQSYRSKDEVEYWKGRDPISIHRRRLVEHGILSEAAFADMEERVRAELDEAVRFAKESPFPEGGALVEDMYADAIPIE